jgi:hypothetical protein
MVLMFNKTVPGRAAADPTSNADLGRAQDTYKVTSVEYVPTADVTGAATNSLTLELHNRGSDDSIDVTLAGLALLAGVNAGRRFAKVITLVTTNGTPLVQEGDRLEWRSVKVGTGLADPGGVVVVNGTAV